MGEPSWGEGEQKRGEREGWKREGERERMTTADRKKGVVTENEAED